MIWQRRLLDDLGENEDGPSLLWGDNYPSIPGSYNQNANHSATKSIDTKHKWAWERIHTGELIMSHIHRAIVVAEAGTKQESPAIWRPMTDIWLDEKFISEILGVKTGQEPERLRAYKINTNDSNNDPTLKYLLANDRHNIDSRLPTKVKALLVHDDDMEPDAFIGMMSLIEHDILLDEILYEYEYTDMIGMIEEEDLEECEIAHRLYMCNGNVVMDSDWEDDDENDTGDDSDNDENVAVPHDEISELHSEMMIMNIRVNEITKRLMEIEIDNERDRLARFDAMCKAERSQLVAGMISDRFERIRTHSRSVSIGDDINNMMVDRIAGVKPPNDNVDDMDQVCGPSANDLFDDDKDDIERKENEMKADDENGIELKEHDDIQRSQNVFHRQRVNDLGIGDIRDDTDVFVSDSGLVHHVTCSSIIRVNNYTRMKLSDIPNDCCRLPKRCCRYRFMNLNLPEI